MRSLMYCTLFFFLLVSFWSVVTLNYMIAACATLAALAVILILNRFDDGEE